MKIYAVRDKLAGFCFVMSQSNDEVAKRNFNLMYKPDSDNVEDFELWYVGDWNTDSGKIKAVTPDFVCRGMKTMKGDDKVEICDAV